ncbi:MAG: putative inorganic carbon transporter subunit DabA, partial [Robiginitalea sp.]|nr:putative inorganic carbon transporter subunit DabA [Robiginitalea sp.]
LFDAGVPASHQSQLQALKADLLRAQQTATGERLGTHKNSIALAQEKAAHWGETRPEWGLAKNAGFVIAPRSLTKNTHLDGRCFLHSYNWELDSSGAALEGIMQGPMVVTQWINNHYYFSTVDNDTFGGGSKITHNITGKFGVVQGNGGDLKMGLPLQSLKETDQDLYHKPLRLSVVIQAPLRWVSEILLRNDHLKQLLDNEWIYLLVMDPLQQNSILRYEQNMKWVDAEKEGMQAPLHPKKVEEPQLEKALY